jgi:hypothetical protein
VEVSALPEEVGVEVEAVAVKKGAACLPNPEFRRLNCQTRD